MGVLFFLISLTRVLVLPLIFFSLSFLPEISPRGKLGQPWVSLCGFPFSQDHSPALLLCKALQQLIPLCILPSFIVVYDRWAKPVAVTPFCTEEEVTLLDFYKLPLRFYKKFDFFVVLQSISNYALHSQFRDLISHVLQSCHIPNCYKIFPSHFSEHFSWTFVSYPTAAPRASLFMSNLHTPSQSRVHIIDIFQNIHPKT